jgi:hypothetical protein
VNAGEVRIEYCPTSIMIADFFTKPLQGLTFRTFRNFIMNVSDPGSNRDQDPRSVLEPEKHTVPHTTVSPSNDWIPVVSRKHKRVKFARSSTTQNPQPISKQNTNNRA